MKKLLSIPLFFVAFALPLYLFEMRYRVQFDELELNSGGIYRDAPFFYLPISVLLALVVGWASTRFTRKKIFRLIVIFVYILFYMWMCFFIADESKQLLGFTWSNTEILTELIFSKWYFYVFGSTGLATFIFLNIHHSGKKQ